MILVNLSIVATRVCVHAHPHPMHMLMILFALIILLSCDIHVHDTYIQSYTLNINKDVYTHTPTPPHYCHASHLIHACLHMCSASKYGIYTLLDAHQDVLSQKFCGEGIPDWAVDTGCKIIICLRNYTRWMISLLSFQLH